MNFSSIIVNLLKGITNLGQTLYDVVNYSVDISWLSKLFSFFGSNIDLPSSVNLIGLIFSIGAIPLAVVIVYSIFKP